MKAPKYPPPPPHLSVEMQAFWIEKLKAYELDPEHLLILQSACEQYDRAQDCRTQIKKDGLMLGSKGSKRTRHPLLSVESKATELFARLIDKILPEAEDAQK